MPQGPRKRGWNSKPNNGTRHRNREKMKYIDDAKPTSQEALNEYLESEKIPQSVSIRIESAFDSAYDMPEFYMALANDPQTAAFLSPHMRHKRQ